MRLRLFTYAMACNAVLATLLSFPTAAYAESDDILAQARSLATNERRPQALDILRKHLEVHPQDTDARLLFGTVLSWEGRYQEARSELKQVLEGSPDYTDAIQALINVEFWDDHPERAQQLAHEARRRHPENADFALDEAKALKKLGQTDEAKIVLENFLEFQPNSQKAKEMRDDLNEVQENWSASIEQTSTWFSDHRSFLQQDTYGLKAATDYGSVFVRFYHADQYSLGSNLVELEAYPQIRSGTYADISAAYSPDANLFPHYRAAADIYQSLPNGFEVSGGYRLFRFGSSTNMATGSVGKYYGNWLFTLRAFLTPTQVDASRSFQLSARRYFGDGDRYMTFRYGTGATPFEVLTLNQIGILNSNAVSVDYNRRFRRRWTVTLLTGFSQNHAEVNGFRQYILDGTVYYRF
jgi:YaiO family outer membrane protein